MPGIRCLKLYKALGGTVITVGSDAHLPEDVESGFIEALGLVALTESPAMKNVCVCSSLSKKRFSKWPVTSILFWMAIKALWSAVRTSCLNGSISFLEMTVM